ncbi:UDP-glycosyltransferase 91A1-like [Eucalyptus grandis]|uniref:UDP-glycosyltransferase 91A1-like n=1 Tax=Eucalyptus grandis TaxID=71139 RepID=UPI00192E803E|nr:UDP-glycosyltransferase 91A1-like [Eucalyptus grandis]
MMPYLKKAYNMLKLAVAEFLASSDVDWVIQDFISFCIYNANSLAFASLPSFLIDGQARAKTVKDLIVVPEWVTYPTKVAYRHHEMINEEDFVDFDTDMSILKRSGRLIQGRDIVAVRACSEFEAEPLSPLKKLYTSPVVPLGLLPPQNKRCHEGDGRWSELKQ